MRAASFPTVKDIVLIGGGHAHVSVLRSFAMFPIAGARLTLISPEVDTPYSGMLPGLVAGHYTFDEAHIDLGPLARFAGARYAASTVTGIDPEARLIHCGDGRPPLHYDVVSINTGSTPVFDDQLVLGRDVIPVKPVSGFLAEWPALKARVVADPGRRVGVVGGGAGGIEMLLAMQYAIATAAGRTARRTAGQTAGQTAGNGPGAFHVLTRDVDVLTSHGGKVQAALRGALESRGVTVHTGFDVVAVNDTGVSDGERTVALDDILWVTGAEAPAWFRESGIAVDARGFIAVNDRLQSTSHPDVFGAGDAVSMIHDPRPKSGVFAVRQGPILAHNLRARMLARPLKRYQAQRAFLSLVSTGDKFAVASHSGWSVAGEWVWRWKDRIDRAFMQKFNALPKMTERPATTIPTVAEVPAEVLESLEPGAMRCGGCGAKVGAATLKEALAGLARRGGTASAQQDAEGADGVVLGIGDDAAAIAVPAARLLVQTVDSFPAMIDDPFVFGRITAVHCLGDIYAMAAVPHSALVTVALPFATDAKRAVDLEQLLAGVQIELDRAGCRIIGGHTGEAAELTLGLTINGLAAPGQLALSTTLTAGLALILTKPIGSGALFAAHARGSAKGREVGGAIANALVSNKAAAAILRAHGAAAMSDVTGFGLAGHLGQMLAAAGVRAELRLADVPRLAGAERAVCEGIVSSLQRENLVWRERITAPDAAAGDPCFQLLFDPQTAGGLIAGVPQAQADDAITALRAAGYGAAARIGTVVGATPEGGASGALITVR